MQFPAKRQQLKSKNRISVGSNSTSHVEDWSVFCYLDLGASISKAGFGIRESTPYFSFETGVTTLAYVE